MRQFDQAARYAATRDPPGFLRWLVPTLDPALTFRGWLDPRTLPFPGEPDTREMTLSQVPGVGLRLQVVQRTLRVEEAASTLQGIAAGAVCLLPWIPLMHEGSEAGIMETWKLLASAEPDHRRRADDGALAAVFADLAGRLPAWRPALEGWNMRASQQVSEWPAEARTEGRVETKREVLLRLLQLRFTTPVPEDLTAAVAAVTDDEELSRWVDAAATAASLEEFRARVGR